MSLTPDQIITLLDAPMSALVEAHMNLGAAIMDAHMAGDLSFEDLMHATALAATLMDRLTQSVCDAGEGLCAVASMAHARYEADVAAFRDSIPDYPDAA